MSRSRNQIAGSKKFPDLTLEPHEVGKSGAQDNVSQRVPPDRVTKTQANALNAMKLGCKAPLNDKYKFYFRFVSTYGSDVQQQLQQA